MLIKYGHNGTTWLPEDYKPEAEIKHRIRIRYDGIIKEYWFTDKDMAALQEIFAEIL